MTGRYFELFSQPEFVYTPDLLVLLLEELLGEAGLWEVHCGLDGSVTGFAHLADYCYLSHRLNYNRSADQRVVISAGGDTTCVIFHSADDHHAEFLINPKFETVRMVRGEKVYYYPRRAWLRAAGRRLGLDPPECLEADNMKIFGTSPSFFLSVGQFLGNISAHSPSGGLWEAELDHNGCSLGHLRYRETAQILQRWPISTIRKKKSNYIAFLRTGGVAIFQMGSPTECLTATVVGTCIGAKTVYAYHHRHWLEVFGGYIPLVR